jgi:hypothetical protein
MEMRVTETVVLQIELLRLPVSGPSAGSRALGGDTFPAAGGLIRLVLRWNTSILLQ